MAGVRGEPDGGSKDLLAFGFVALGDVGVAVELDVHERVREGDVVEENVGEIRTGWEAGSYRIKPGYRFQSGWERTHRGPTGGRETFIRSWPANETVRLNAAGDVNVSDGGGAATTACAQ